jgi:capsular polysaccharide biosynthesis protein
MNIIGKGMYLTPQTRPVDPLNPSDAIERTSINGGLIYGEDYNIVSQSIDQRFSTIPIDLNIPIDNRLDQQFLFLGYYFRHYGHFILETLPMLSYCMDPRWISMKKIFLPYFLNANNIKHNLNKESNLNLIKDFIKLSGINLSNIYFHTSYNIIKSNFIVPPKAVNGNKNDVNVNLYRSVIDKIKHNFQKISPTRKVLILRKPDSNRMTPIITNEVNRFAINNNIELIDMTKLSIIEQIQLMHETECLIGFSGSGMHNSMFLQPKSISINICDFRDFKSPKCYIPNQRLCNRISNCQEHFIDFKFDENIITKPNFKPPNDKLNQKQQEFAADHIIKNLETIIQ